VIAHGGKFWVETNGDGRSTTVKLALPCAGALHRRAHVAPAAAPIPPPA
jgi:hypothetical protein